LDAEEILRREAEEHLLEEANRRRFLYRDVFALIEEGFLHQSVKLPGSTVTLRSFLPQDWPRLQARLAGARGNLSGVRWTVSSAIWMVDGFEVPTDPKENGAWHLYREWVSELPAPLLKVLYSHVVGLRRRVGVAVKLTEAFCYEPYGRSLWRTLGKPIGDLENKNTVTQVWAAHNLAEDQMREQDRQWEHTRAIVSSMSHKAGKHIAESLKKASDREEERRRKVIEETVNWIISGEKRAQKPVRVVIGDQEYEVPRIYSAQTAEDLHEEMRKVFTGEKDFHDQVVQDYHERIRARVEERRLEQQKRMEEARRKMEEAELEGGPAVVGYTREQLQQLDVDLATHKTTSIMPEAAAGSYLYDRYVSPQLKPGVLTPDLTVEGSDPPPSEEGGGESLQDRLQRRKPTLRRDGE
jgi:hypothetical protein